MHLNNLPEKRRPRRNERHPCYTEGNFADQRNILFDPDGWHAYAKLSMTALFLLKNFMGVCR